MTDPYMNTPKNNFIKGAILSLVINFSITAVGFYLKDNYSNWLHYLGWFMLVVGIIFIVANLNLIMKRRRQDRF